MQIICFSDYACPFCYIGEVRLFKAIEALNAQDKIDFQLRAFELDPKAPKTMQTDTVTRFAQKYRLPIEEAKKQIQHICDLGKTEGIDFQYDKAKYTNTFDAHRLMKFALSKNDRQLAKKTNNLIFDAYFSKSLQLSDYPTLFAIAEMAGLDIKETQSMLEAGEFGEAVRKDEEEANRLGIRGVPYFIFDNGIVIPGAASTEDLKHVILENLKIFNKPFGVQSCNSQECTISSNVKGI